MTATLQEALAAVRAGETERAQLLAADVIRDNPDDAHAWYLLSQLVDSDARRAAYLGKALALDPTHERARTEFDALPADVLAPLGLTIAPEAEAELEPVAAEAMPAAPDGVPEWLRPLSPEPTPAALVAEAVAPVQPTAPVAAPEITRPAAAQPAPVPAAPKRTTPPPPPPPARRGNGALTALLVLLALLTLAVLSILAYLLLGGF